jgi:hypothetical protein
MFRDEITGLDGTVRYRTMTFLVTVLQVMCRICEKPVERDVFYRSHIRRHHQLREEEYVAKERLEYLLDCQKSCVPDP